MSVRLKHLDVEDLTGRAGGNPWQLNNGVQSGSPGRISELATAFHEAGVCTQETTEEFSTAKQRFEAAWDRHDGGDHPINDSAEVRRATDALLLNAEQLSRIAVDLQNIPASLAEAQRSGDVSIGNLETTLRLIDDRIDRAIVIAAAEGRAVDWSELKEAAVDATEQALQEVHTICDAYGAQLDASRLEGVAEDYARDAIASVDGRGGDPTNAMARAEAQTYETGQRSADEALVNAAGAWTPEKQAAAARLRDVTTITSPTADVDEVRYAGERLSDFRMSQFVGPLPKDTVLGGDARTRAQARLQMQDILELPTTFPGDRPLTPDQATLRLNEWETRGRAMVLSEFASQLQQAGMSPAGAALAANQVQNGASPTQVIRDATAGLATHVSALGEGTTAHAGALPGGEHWGTAPVWSNADIEAMKGFGTKLGWAGTAVDAAVTFSDWRNGEPAGEAAAKFGGRTLGAIGAGWAAGATWGSLVGPHGTLVVGFLGAIGGGFGGEKAVNWMLGK